MAFWWASQGKNYPIAIDQGTLWTCPRFDGREPPDRSAIKDIRSGDVVFHHEHKVIRAISVAASEWQPAARPEGYPKKRPEDRDDGWVVYVQPIATDVDIPLDEYRNLVRRGDRGPLTKNGIAAQKYLSPLSVEEGQALLERAELTGLASDTTSAEPGALGIGATDAASTGSVRIEQAALRAHLLGGQAEAACGLCGQFFPAEFLVAGHVKPRSLCSDDERWDFDAAAMLFCLLGCDVLFEKRYVAVTEGAQIVRGRSSTSTAVDQAVAALVGRQCHGYTDTLKAAFVAHAKLAAETF